MVKVRIKRLEWDKHNIAHIARHKVVPEEVEEVYKGEVVRLRSKSHNIRIVLIGKTDAKRSLKIVFEPKSDGIWRPVTAHDASRKDRELYQREIGGEKVT